MRCSLSFEERAFIYSPILPCYFSYHMSDIEKSLGRMIDWSVSLTLILISGKNLAALIVKPLRLKPLTFTLKSKPC